MARIKRLDSVLALKTINLGLGTRHLTLGAALKALELPYLFAGREQFLRNLTGEGVDDQPALWNVGRSNPRYDENAKRLLVGHIRDAEHPKADLRFWRALVPAWASGVRNQLNAHGVPFSVELLTDPAININGDAPLFVGGADGTPSSSEWAQLTGLQRGELAMFKFGSAIDLMLEGWPAYNAHYHRPAGTTSPFPGLTFGSMDYVNGVRRMSPLRSTNLYHRWAAAGMPE